jgi:hypothetical protein
MKEKSLKGSDSMPQKFKMFFDIISIIKRKHYKKNKCVTITNVYKIK